MMEYSADYFLDYYFNTNDKQITNSYGIEQDDHPTASTKVACEKTPLTLTCKNKLVSDGVPKLNYLKVNGPTTDQNEFPRDGEYTGEEMIARLEATATAMWAANETEIKALLDKLLAENAGFLGFEKAGVWVRRPKTN
jgi:hypothetical protein